MSRWLASLALLATYATAQTTTACNPLKATCPEDPALGTTFQTTFNDSMAAFDPQFFNVTAGNDLITFSNNGAELTISELGQSITVETAFYIMFGRVEMMLQAASGVGIISTYNLLSDDLDEIDLEIMGGNTSYITNNFFGWGNGTNSNNEPTNGPNWQGGAMGGMHNYTVDWSAEQIQWYMDGDLVRTQPYMAAGKYPQSPCYLKFGIWAGGASTEPKGTRQWAGGDTDWSQGPFTMTVQSLKITDGHQNASFYKYGDHSGSWQSIDAIPGESYAYKAINQKDFTQSVEQKWSGLSTTAKIAVGCGVGGAFLIALIAFTFYCIHQRKQGKAEKALADKQWEAAQAENNELRSNMAAYQKQMRAGHFAVSHLGHGEKF